MSDVRSLEEVIADTLCEYAVFEGLESTAQLLANHVAAAVREWCLAPQQIERATTRGYTTVRPKFRFWHDGDIVRVEGWAVRYSLRTRIVRRFNRWMCGS